MRKVVLFIAMSLDGYLADREGKVDWLRGQSEDEADMDTYSAFIREVDTVILGRNTYEQIVTELSPEEWVYAGLTSYVITHRPQPSTGEIRFTAESPCEIVERLKGEPGKTIWICGGGKVIAPLMEADLIDEYHISVIPTLLGSGIRLFGALPEERRLKLLRTQSGNGILEAVYTRR